MNEIREAVGTYVPTLGGIHDTTKHHQLCGYLFGCVTPNVDYCRVFMLIL